MVIDNLKNFNTYIYLNPLFVKLADFIATTNLKTIERGRGQIEGDELFYIVSDTDLKQKSEARLEVHNSYIDVQIPLDRDETFGWKSRKQLIKPHQVFDEEKDIQFFDDEPQLYFTLKASDFCILLPGDAHAPCIGEGIVHKIIFKVKV